MSGILSQIITPELWVLIILFLIIILGLYVVSILWVVRDSYLRGASSVRWGLLSLIPFLGAFAYVMLRPPMLLADKDEQSLDFTLKQRELLKYGECARCGGPIEDDYVMCPFCGTQVKNVCQSCGRPLAADWKVCPWCCKAVKE